MIHITPLATQKLTTRCVTSMTVNQSKVFFLLEPASPFDSVAVFHQEKKQTESDADRHIFSINRRFHSHVDKLHYMPPHSQQLTMRGWRSGWVRPSWSMTPLIWPKLKAPLSQFWPYSATLAPSIRACTGPCCSSHAWNTPQKVCLGFFPRGEREGGHRFK